MLTAIRAVQSAMIHSRHEAFDLPRVHTGVLPSLERPGLFGD